MKNMKEKNNKKMNCFVFGIFASVMIAALAFTACSHPADNLPNHAHKWGEWEIITTATCITAGVETRECALDAAHKETRPRAIDPNAHDWRQLSGTAPTCTTTGSGKRKCRLCDEEETLDVIPALGHNYKWVIAASTCTTMGTNVGTCTHDATHESIFPIPIDPNAHNWGNNWTITIPPTVVQAGTETDTCTHNTSHTRTRSITTAAFTDITDLDIYLSGLSDNTAAAAYTVKLNVNSLGSANVTGSVGAILKDNSAKYVSLDLSDCTITGIEDNAFQSCANLINVNIPDSVTGIGESAFNGCTGLANVTIPSGVTSIGSSAFNRCISLTGVTIPNSVNSIGIAAFQSCAGLTSINIPSSVTDIKGSVFNRCTGITSVTIPGSVKSIGDWSFGNNVNLTTVTFQGTIPASDFNSMGSFFGDLRDKFYATNSTNGTPGTYTTTAPVSASSIWTKQ
jgi:hypothetical protein